MNNELGVWTCQDCALVLIDCQKEFGNARRRGMVEPVDPGVTEMLP